MNREIVFCNDCPCYSIDSEPGVEYCGLAHVLDKEVSVIYDGEDDYPDKWIPPKWCPLRSGPISLELVVDEDKIKEIEEKQEKQRLEKIKAKQSLDMIELKEKMKTARDIENDEFWNEIVNDALREINNEE